MANQLKKLIGMKKEELDDLANSTDEIFLHPARLIPTTKPGDELTLTSIFLSGLCLIKEFRNLFFSEVKLPKSGKIYTYTEVSFSEFKDVRFDGLLLIVKGRIIKEAAIFEMKNKHNELDNKQIETYAKIAKKLQINKIISISNQFVSMPTQYPIVVKVPKSIELYHFSWSYILTLSRILLFENDMNIEDPDQVEIMKEIVAYMEHPIAGVCGFTRMRPGWKEAVEKITTGSKLKLSDQCVNDAVISWQQEERDMALILSRKLGLFVKSGFTKFKKNLQLRIDNDKKLLINNNILESTLKVSGAVSELTIRALFKRRIVEMSVKLNVPEGKTIRGQLGFIKKQLGKCEKKNPEKFQTLSDYIFLGINIKNAKGIERCPFTELGNIHQNLKNKEINDVRIILIKDFGKKFSSTAKIVEIMEQMLIDFYKGIVQHLSRWEKPAPKINEEETIAED